MDRILATLANKSVSKKRARCDENETPLSEEKHAPPPVVELSPLEQVCFFELYQKYAGDPLVRDMEKQAPLKAKDPRAKDMLIVLMMVDRQHMTKQLEIVDELRSKVLVRDERIVELEKTIALLSPIQDILKENKEMQTLIFKQNSEKRTLEETIQKLEMQLADISTRISQQFQHERDAVRKNANERLNNEYWTLIEFINKVLYKKEPKEISVVTTNEVRDAVINFADTIRLILHPI